MHIPYKLKSLTFFILFVVLCLSVGAIGGLVTAESVGSWYPTLQRPSFNPPDWIFGPVWTLLYTVMGYSVWRVWSSFKAPKRRCALILFGIQLFFNLGWSVIFFGLQEIAFAFIHIIALDLLVGVTIFFFWRIDRLAGLVLVPYLVWLLFATVLNAMIWHLN